jgi:uncharacterized repeat protein (TIGR03837 family)
MSPRRWDVFCRVIDNYGDAGVCWRLARQMVAEHALDVTLWIDRLATLARFQPGVDVAVPVQAVAGVRLRHLRDDQPPAEIPDVVVEAFGCGLPAPYLDVMARAPMRPLWINLEYLSAEPWVDSVHGLASPQPRLPLERYFWFPGFTHHTGGLIREAGLLDARARFDARRHPRDALNVLLFCYPNRVLPALFDAWSEGDEPLRCTMPEGVAAAALDQWLHGDVPHVGQVIGRGRLEMQVVPFGTQDAFDELLWRSDLNFVRGEDSFVRAQWAARAFVWQPYPQAENAHRLKLDAFLSRYAADLRADVRQSLESFWRAFNDEDSVPAVDAWPRFRAAIDGLASHGRHWADTLAQLPELTASLVEFARGRL